MRGFTFLLCVRIIFMKKAPSIPAMKKWLVENKPLGLFSAGQFTLADIDPKPWSGHFNYLTHVRGKRFVLRFRGPEWGEPDGIVDEYAILSAVAPFALGPKVYYLSKDFFGEPMMLQEYLSGTSFTALPKKQQDRFFPAVARFIAHLNKIPDSPALSVCMKKMESYAHHKETWRTRLDEISLNPRTKKWGEKIETLLPGAEMMLNRFDDELGRTLRKQKPVFIFKSAHAGHLIKLARGFRFVNWEQIGRGDPGYTLAVFLASLSDRPDFERIKKRMLSAYLKENPVPEFEALVEARLSERAVSNLIWVLWNHARAHDKRSPEKATSVTARFAAVETMLNAMG